MTPHALHAGKQNLKSWVSLLFLKKVGAGLSRDMSGHKAPPTSKTLSRGRAAQGLGADQQTLFVT
jgi:hypothetical protein